MKCWGEKLLSPPFLERELTQRLPAGLLVVPALGANLSRLFREAESLN